MDSGWSRHSSGVPTAAGIHQADMLTDAEIEMLLADNTVSLDVLAATLINAANAKGGRDTIPVVQVSQQV